MRTLKAPADAVLTIVDYVTSAVLFFAIEYSAGYFKYRDIRPGSGGQDKRGMFYAAHSEMLRQHSVSISGPLSDEFRMYLSEKTARTREAQAESAQVRVSAQVPAHSEMTEAQWKDAVWTAWRENDQERLAELREMVDQFPAPAVSAPPAYHPDGSLRLFDDGRGMSATDGVSYAPATTETAPVAEITAPALRLEYLRRELRAERISYDGLTELQSLAGSIAPGDVELLEAAGVPEKDED